MCTVRTAYTLHTVPRRYSTPRYPSRHTLEHASVSGPFRQVLHLFVSTPAYRRILIRCSVPARVQGRRVALLLSHEGVELPLEPGLCVRNLAHPIKELLLPSRSLPPTHNHCILDGAMLPAQGRRAHASNTWGVLDQGGRTVADAVNYGMDQFAVPDTVAELQEEAARAAAVFIRFDER